MEEELSGIGNGKAVKIGKGRIQVSLLDDTVVAFDVESKSKGEVLYQKVNGHLKVEEADYFGLQYYDSEGNMCWLDSQKQINKQVKEASKVTFKFRVMFYTPDPNALQEYTRYLFTLQVRRDLLDGRLHCSEDTGSLLASYIVQGELGDYDPTTHQDGYLSGFQFVPNQTSEIEEKIIQYHMSHRGKSPAEADRSMLEVARQLEMYGITLYPAKDRDDADLSLSVFHMGILVLQNQSKINMFSWAKIRKLSFKKKKFIIKLHPKVYTADVVEFIMQGRDACKGFWKICIAHHIFFRQRQSVPKRRKSSVFSRGSKFRYSGRTQKQLMEDSRDSFKPTAELERTRSARMQRGNDTQSPVASVNSNDMSAVPITPPPSYSSFKFESPFRAKESTPSFKNSTDASEDEGSFVIGSRKASQQIGSTSETESLQQESSSFIEETVVKLQKQDTNEEKINGDKELPNGDDVTVLSRHEEGDESSRDRRERTESDLEIEREVHSLLDQIKQEPSWQYHLTTTDLDDKDDSLIGDSHLDDVATMHVNGEIDQIGHVNTDKRIEPNGDVNANEVGDVIVTNDEILAKKMTDVHIQPSCSYDSDSGGSVREQEEQDQAFDAEIEIARTLSDAKINGEHGESPVELDSTPYHMAKEILLTERTYIKDLEVLTVSFRELVTTVVSISDSLMNSLFGNMDPLYDFHCSLLAELEDRLSMWESTAHDNRRKNIHKIGDIMLSNMKQLNAYIGFVNKHDQTLMDLENEINKSDKLRKACKEFELNKICYMPLNSFILKPTQRLLYYKSILGRLCKEYKGDDQNYLEIKSAYDEVVEACKAVSGSLKNLENLHKTIELDRDLTGVENIVHPQREFIREGCLYKVCRKGPQPRMFFLFSDTLLYTTQGLTIANQFRVRAQIPLKYMKIEEGGIELHGLSAFTIHNSCGRSFVVAATSPEERYKWMEDLKAAMANAKSEVVCENCKANQNDIINENAEIASSMCPGCNQEINTSQQKLPPIHIKKSPKEQDSDDEHVGSLERVSSLDRRHAHVRTLSTRRVCWHRNTSISMNEYKISVQNNLSGELYRKFKNSPKWQRLWVVFTNFSLFFFKSCEDDEPIASLPLIGYSVSKPTEVEGVVEEFAFKLQFKAHVYFFRAESEYAFNRWMEVLSSATKSASRTRIFSRMTSDQQ